MATDAYILRQLQTRQTEQRSYVSMVWRQFRRNYPAVTGAVVLLLLSVIAAAAPWIAPYDPNAIDLSPQANLAAPSRAHLFGTDDSGRDWLSRAIYGARVSLSVAMAAMLISISLGTAVGALSGFLGGWVDIVLMRLVEVLLSLPLFLVVLIAQSLLPPSIFTLVWVIGLTSWMRVSRVVRGEVMAVRAMEYTEAARAVGVGHGRMLVRHILPNTSGPIIVAATLTIGYAILTEAALSYLGLGVPLPEPSWGNMFQKGISRLRLAPWLVMVPGVLITITVLAFNAVGDGLRDAFDPHMNR